jgi:hypothetical protein
MKKMLKTLYDSFVDNIYSEVVKSPVRILPITFLFLCILGGILLYLPFSGTMSFIDALFTAVSGVCVTGLSVSDIAIQLNTFGQFTLMLLIQVGGPAINSSFLENGLLDEVSTVMGLGVDGRKDMPSIFDGFNMDKSVVHLKFKTAKVFETGAVWLRYNIV